MLKDLLGKRKYITISTVKLDEVNNDENRPSVPDGMWTKCKSCDNIIYKDDLNDRDLELEQ